MFRVPSFQPLPLSSSAGRSAPNQYFPIRDSLTGIVEVIDPSGTVHIDSTARIPDYSSPLAKFASSVIYANRDDTHNVDRLIEDLFAQV